MSSIKIALTGNTGVGKDTFVEILRSYNRLSDLKEIKLATPLYEVQNFIYDTCQKPKDFLVQDGELLNFLGGYMRKINPDILKNHFLKELNRIKDLYHVIVCSDARPQDLPFIREQNFIIIKIIADKKFSMQRRISRGDISLASTSHTTEVILDNILYDYRIENNGTLDQYKESVLSLMEELYDTHG